MGLVSTFTDVQFPKVGELFGPEGQLKDPAYRKRVQRSYDELIWMATCLRWGRDHL